MSHRVYFGIKSHQNADLEKHKNHYFGSKFFWQANKNNSELKMAKLLENHVKTHD